ncbi:hypothetical protein PR048_018035, partial [Dryococelus australis]
MFSRTVLDMIITTVSRPVVKNWRWPIRLSRFPAKYLVYSIMDLDTGLDFELVQKGMVKSELERAVCENIMGKLFLSDRHKGIKIFIKTRFANVEHEFDVWHVFKSLMKKIKALDKNHLEIQVWKANINNHLWWSAQTSNGDSSVLVDKSISILHHTKNEHKWLENGEYKSCEHELSEEEKKTNWWLNGHSSAYQAPKEIILDKSFLKDVEHTKHNAHTGSLESYHNLRLKYAPKRVHFSYSGLEF